MSQLHSDSIGTEDSRGESPRPIDRIPQVGETVFFRRYHHGKQKEECRKLTIVPNTDSLITSETIVSFIDESGEQNLIIAGFRKYNPETKQIELSEFNTFLFWD